MREPKNPQKAYAEMCADVKHSVVFQPVDYTKMPSVETKPINPKRIDDPFNPPETIIDQMVKGLKEIMRTDKQPQTAAKQITLSIDEWRELSEYFKSDERVGRADK